MSHLHTIIKILKENQGRYIGYYELNNFSYENAKLLDE